MCICEAAQHNWTYNGISGIRSNLLGTGLMLPLVVCVILFVAGSAFVIWEFLKELLKKQLRNTNPPRAMPAAGLWLMGKSLAELAAGKRRKIKSFF